MVFDCETATLPFVGEIAHNAEEKKRVAIAKPLIYDAGWTICNRKGDIFVKRQFLIAETFSVPAIFNTAYYAEKRPIYLKMLANGETTIKSWLEVVKILEEDMQGVDAVGAFNSMFDFKKAIPFTHLYISKLYSPEYYKWEETQKTISSKIANNSIKSKERSTDFDPAHFVFNNKTYNLFDLWGLSTSYLLNNVSYKKQCLNHGMLTNSGVFFKTSAESTYRYLCDKYDFDEAHTALDDAIIETFILSRIAARHSIEYGIKYFPFKDLGETTTFCKRRKVPDYGECDIVVNAINAYVQSKNDNCSPYVVGLINKLNDLLTYMEEGSH